MAAYPAQNLLLNSYTNWLSVWPYDEAHSNGVGYRDFSLHKEFPVLDSLHANYEKEFTGATYWAYLSRYYASASIVASVFYLIFVFGGERLMRDRKAFGLKYPLIIWNFILAAFSIIGTTRLLPHLVYGLWINDSSYFFCREAGSAYSKGPVGLWANMFVWSKFFELIDTVFLVLRKKPVSFLHWFHHTTVLMYCWHASQFQMPTGIFFATFNYLVHAVMYTYYFIAAVTKPPKWGKFVTVIQIIQMFAGIIVTGYHYYLLGTVENCDGSYNNLLAAFIMYTAYMLLFIEFFISRYMSKKSSVKDQVVKKPATTNESKRLSRVKKTN